MLQVEAEVAFVVARLERVDVAADAGDELRAIVARAARQVEIILEARAEELHPGDAVAAVLRELQSLAVEDEVVHARDDAVGSGLGVDERHHLRDAVLGLRNRLRFRLRLDLQVLHLAEVALQRTLRVARAGLHDELVVARFEKLRRVRDEELLRDDFVDDEVEGRAQRVLNERHRPLVVQHHVEPRDAEPILPVDQVVRLRRRQVHHVVDPELRQRLVRHNRRNDVREREVNRLVEPQGELQRVALGVERGVRRRERPRDDAADRADVRVDPHQRLLLQLADDVERASQDRLHLNRRETALLGNLRNERGELDRLLGDVAAGVGRNLLHSPLVLVNHDFMLCHNQPPYFTVTLRVAFLTPNSSPMPLRV